MRPIDKTSEDLFQKLRSRFSPISMGDENADETATPADARIFNFMYKEGDNDIGYVSISIIDNRSFKVYYGADIIENMENKTDWYAFLRDLRMFAKRNLMSFDARDLAKNQLEPRDFKFISNQDGTYKEHEVAVSESVMFGSRRKSYQTSESAKLIVNHRRSVDETVPGARSRYIESIYIENADGERYKFPYNYLTGARSMLSHVSEGGNPYDDIGRHIVGMVKEMKDLSKFARRTKKYAMEDEQASSIREKVVERFQSLKKQLGGLSVKENYKRFAEAFKPSEEEDGDVEQLKERFTRQVFDSQLEDTLPAVNRALKEAELAAANKPVSQEAVQFEAWASELVPEGKFGGEKAAYKMGMIHGAKGEGKINAEKSFGQFADYYYRGYEHGRENMDWRLSHKPITLKKTSEATTTGTTGTMGTTGTTTQKPVNPGELLKDPQLQQAAKNVGKVVQAAGIKTPVPQLAQAMAAQAAGKQPTQQAKQAVGGLGNTIMQAAASDPKKAAQLQAMMKKMVVQGKFDEDAVRSFLTNPNAK